MTNGLYRRPANRVPQNVNTWHFRGGLQGFGQFQTPATLAYGVDDEGNLYPLIYGNDAQGNLSLVTESNNAPWYGAIIQSGIQTAGNIFGARNYNAYSGYSPAGGGLTTNVTASPAGVGAGFNLSTNTLIIGGIVLAFFLLGRGRR